MNDDEWMMNDGGRWMNNEWLMMNDGWINEEWWMKDDEWMNEWMDDEWLIEWWRINK